MEIYLELTQEQWTEVLDKASKNDAAMLILRCWANPQSISSGAVNAFKGNVVTLTKIDGTQVRSLVT